jgi:hypothetical protein
MLGDLLHDTTGSSGAASCASTTAAWLGRLRWGLIVVVLTDNSSGRCECGGGEDTGEELEHKSPYILVHTSMRMHISMHISM